jgi:hypothetical protein
VSRFSPDRDAVRQRSERFRAELIAGTPTCPFIGSGFDQSPTPLDGAGREYQANGTNT